MFDWNYPLLFCPIHHHWININIKFKPNIQLMNIHIKVSNKDPFRIFFPQALSFKHWKDSFSNINCEKHSFLSFWWLQKLKHLELFPLHLQSFRTPLTTTCGFNFSSLKSSSKCHWSNHLTPRSTCASQAGALGTSRDSVTWLSVAYSCEDNKWLQDLHPLPVVYFCQPK